ncbi:MAG TPA: sigma-70 family RNA polymerase sigma factor [Chryseosolibacter sp.]|nr:sigma-70 family RNA polymerase sigma factor [Chryseosolibacter sp.]
MQDANTAKLVDHLFRHESGKMVAVLTKLLGFKNLDTAHDIIQDTLLSAMTLWSYGKLPENPTAWLYHVARNKAIDFLRREQARPRIQSGFSQSLDPIPETATANLFLETEIEDSVLRMMFACCHPDIPIESRIAMALKTLGGMTSREIAHAFLTSEDTIIKRIYRAREKIKNEKIPLDVPVSGALLPRLESVLQVLYLLFNEGYNSSHPDTLIRHDLCSEAMRLCHLLTRHTDTDKPATNALMALMCFQASRLDSRIDQHGNIITLKYQDRSTWNRQLISRGFHYLDRAAELNSFSLYHLEAGIASVHAASPSFEQTDWKAIYHLYEILYSINPSPVVALNKAIASSYAVSAQSALDALQNIKGLENNHLYYASLAEVCLGLGKNEDARNYFDSAISLTDSKLEKELLKQKRDAVDFPAHP